MLTEERYELILQAIKEKGIVKLNELVEITESSESTIRRDLSYLESKNALKRVHGGAASIKRKVAEPSYKEKLVQNSSGKTTIAKYAASLIEDGDSIYLDAGTTTFEMIKYIDKKDIVIVTNGLNHIDALIEKDLAAYVLGGKVKAKTKAIVGQDTLLNLKRFRFDKAFVGVNGIHTEYGLTTPDLEEAILKENAIKLSKDAFVLADESKFGEVNFVKFADLEDVAIITDTEIEEYEIYEEKTKIKVVKDK